MNLPRHFGSAYMLTAIFERTFAIAEQSADVAASVAELSKLDSGDCLEKALTTVLFAVDSGKLVHYWRATHALYRRFLEAKKRGDVDLPVPEKCRLVRRITITPTRKLLWPAELMCENRVLRRFDSEYFLRVTFRDDTMGKLNTVVAHRDIYHHAIRLPMTSGIVIGTRHYEMLAWSNSQLREHGASMYATDAANVTASFIRTWTELAPAFDMGIPKYMARIGQCFSQTENSVSLPLNGGRVSIERDIEGGLNPRSGKPYCFSDGVGKISTNLAEQVRERLGHDRDCSAFQVRYGGCKGMLLEDPTLRGPDVVFRDSMKKYAAESHTMLEIARSSAPVPLRLNRPLIAILDDLGVPHAIFLQMQESMLRDLTDMLLDDKKAAEYLNSRTPFSHFKFKDLSMAGIGITTEPFCKALMLALHRYHIDTIKHKASIEIAPNEGRNMLGVLDETGLLNYGEVFVQYTNDIMLGHSSRSDTTIVTGTVMVTKCPCIHPGDVRKFRAVDVAQLRHVVDCIVFPKRGQRPHPDEMAGSDLDGDEYAVIWKPELFFQVPNRNPAQYPHSSDVVGVSIRDLIGSQVAKAIRFLVHFVRNDNIGAVASAHLAQADQQGVDAQVCLSIAEKHAVSVDFAKTGKFAKLTGEEKPKEYPDFMQFSWKVPYRSRKALGKLYRVSKNFENENLKSGLKYGNVQVDPAFLYPGWECYQSAAIASRDKYNRWLQIVLHSYGIQHESEAFAGAFIRLHCRFSERRDRAEIVRMVNASLSGLLKIMVDEFHQEFAASGNLEQVHALMLQKASAWYAVTYGQPDAVYLSFPWIVSGYLANVKLLLSDQPQGVQSVYQPVVSRLDGLILDRAAEGTLWPLPTSVERSLDQLEFFCESAVVANAIRLLIQWADDVDITIMTSPFQPNYLYFDIFVKLVLYVAETKGFVAKRGRPNNTPRVPPQSLTSAALCLAFFRFCMGLRFLSEREVSEIIPFRVYKLFKVAKRAMVAYHRIAVTGRFSTVETHEMEPIYVDVSVFPPSPIPNPVLREAEELLVGKTGVEFVSMREDPRRKKVVVTAEGTESALYKLKNILRKHNLLKTFIQTG